MATVEKDQPLVPSLLDRLLDDDPSVSTEPPKSRTLVARELHHAVRRDLEALLNTRRTCRTWQSDLSELERSLVNYGIPDFTGANLASRQAREEFRRIIEGTIRRFEPRFKAVRVQLLDNADPHDRSLRFRIDALLQAEPAPEPIAFDSVLEPVSRSVEIRSKRDE